MNYKDSGVDVQLADELLETVREDIKISIDTCNSFTNNSILRANDYCACVELNKLDYKCPVLTFSIDGVGSKLKLIEKYPHLFSSVSTDLFAMIFNDIICSGAKPLYLLDYYATHSLNEIDSKSGKSRFQAILEDLLELCSYYTVGLIGGETAEIPSLYEKNNYDLAGFGVGIVEKNKLITPSKVDYHDVIIGLESSGPHSNGYSLINKIIVRKNVDSKFIQDCLIPTEIYINSILKLVNNIDVHGIAHITGGGFNNIGRILPKDFYADIFLSNWDFPIVFKEIQKYAGITTEEMLETFNCGIGMVVIVAEKDLDRTLTILNREHGAFPIGSISYDPKSIKNKITYI